MKKLFAIVGIVVMLSLTLAMPTMAKGNKPPQSYPHYDVNFVTGVTDVSYQIRVDIEDPTTITVNGTGGFAIVEGAICLQAGKTYDVYAQIRGVPGSSASLQIDPNPVQGPYDASPKPSQWKLIGTVVGSTTITIDSNGCTNIATRWFEK